MAKAYCCDRCGDYFKERIVRVVGNPLGSNRSVYLDLCPKCSVQIMGFMKDPKAILVSEPLSETLLKKENSEKGKET